MNNKRVKNVSVVMIITIVSKVLGFVRDIVLADCFGSCTITDAYYVAQTIPEFLFSLVVQSISIGFIPIYSQIFSSDGKKKADKFTNNIIKLCVILVLVIVAVVNIFTREIVYVFASGFNEEGINIASGFVRITTFALIFRIIVSVYNAYLHANDHFISSAFNGIILDIVIIISIIVAFYTNEYGLAFGLVAAAFLQFAALVPVVVKRKSKMNLSLRGLFNSDTKKMFSLILPVLLGVGANQINVLIDKTMASSIVGGISALNYANKVDNVLENIIVLSLATVMFPAFAKEVANKNMNGYKNSIKTSLLVVCVTMIPCAFFAFTFSTEAITVLFARGAFDSTAIANVSAAMKYYSVGLLFLSINAVLTRALYALNKVTVVSVTTTLSVFVNVGMNILLKPLLGIGGLALATSISNIFITMCLLIMLKRFTKISFAKEISFDFLKISVACIIMAFCSYLLYEQVFNDINYIIGTLLSCTAGALIFVILELIMKEKLIFDIKNQFFKLIKTKLK